MRIDNVAHEPASNKQVSADQQQHRLNGIISLHYILPHLNATVVGRLPLALDLIEIFLERK